ncbi:MAG: DUF1816 domain-containing protein [Gomphosphaeria aponina SAG 52.96 = DSM 107014]|uniref:DUF1816 domain-containing protein n=1 Tax=Gomphosphaeria aponina SAG 52.96 = DSM 107014 TaxID=1521640 RepID=A0A941JS55_9CHRO|nr:DUF1816 domain-containing protein [Gomphosphaeria aponina SAG 52.96 = DSM 107014]
MDNTNSRNLVETISDCSVFLYEVINLPQKDKLKSDRTARVLLKVPKNRMSTEMRRITRLGGTIVSIRPLNEVNGKVNQQLPWWIEILTTKPRCIYYFGPFDTEVEAQAYQTGYIQDLQEEGSEGITIQIKQCQPTDLTIF